MSYEYQYLIKFRYLIFKMFCLAWKIHRIAWHWFTLDVVLMCIFCTTNFTIVIQPITSIIFALIEISTWKTLYRHSALFTILHFKSISLGWCCCFHKDEQLYTWPDRVDQTLTQAAARTSIQLCNGQSYHSVTNAITGRSLVPLLSIAYKYTQLSFIWMPGFPK